ncbi:hypothetical protein CCU68_25770 [Pseudomonas gingeri NCPPB 3146 = LMG 5327]|uniref:DUF799 domain-containing protein n=2 Tax=Pseudomonas gingeri TaxID=117681 RepID=A0A7Y7XZK2_9PSED|nr:DUF799 domain-containing protein [Pseudomonas gingeri]NWC14002.1 DUF799 domain-containing protein [Pseudomonas gingeri]NWE49696.1 DUF799 domain-containing protein [Pseudomonas gingeri]NWE72515.1 DUF799 domain-containing protein [Pseudomonas gingeri]PNQ89606.1 hypothetical protein CCU68_25770 [Pseudomonas gingeri NCPPB 3146 = LMG 5327]
MNLRLLSIVVGLLMVSVLGGCARHTTSLDYAAYKEARPRTILVLPPLNESSDIKASYGMLSQVTYPLAEAGYYVMPVALVSETFQQNGLTTANDIHNTSPAKLREIFGADAVLYINVTQYGTQFQVIRSTTTVTASARLVDLKTGTTLWTGSSTATKAQNVSVGGSIAATLISAAVSQAIDTSTDASYPVAGGVSRNMLAVRRGTGLLYGPRSPRYGSD